VTAPAPIGIPSTLVGTVVSVVPPGADVLAGETVAVIESMKMEHVVASPVDGTVSSVAVEPGRPVSRGDLLLTVAAGPVATGLAAVEDEHGTHPRILELRSRVDGLDDAARADVVAKRHALGLRTARENLADLLDPGSYVEYGRFAYAAQTRRRSVEDLVANTPGDGLIAGVGTVNAAQFGEDRAACAVLSYDYTVLAGTQGQRNHQKKDRLFDVIERTHVPVVFFTEGGGGRPGDTDNAVVTGLNTDAFHAFAGLSGQVPTIGIVAGRCFAGNAALLGCCDVVIACEGASIGMGGPAMIEGGGLGVVAADEVGPAAMHALAGSIDLLVADEAQAVDAAKRLLGFVQGDATPRSAAAGAAIADVLPRDRRRAYDVREVIDAIFDAGSVLELRASFGLAMVTALGRLEGRAVAILANNPTHLAGAIDADAADKAARFLQLAEAWGLPVVSLVDTPGFMVGPEAERTGLVRHAGRMFVAGAALTVPLVSLVTRRGYGLGSQAMCGGSFTAPLLTVAWPQAELGAMGLEGAVRLGFRRELEAIEDPGEREAAFAGMVDAAYEHGRALNVAAHLELDDVIDPETTRSVLSRTLRRAPARSGTPRPRRFVDTW
jgi:acetyl-CoA carboxylase carboxyltransferase component